MPGAGAKGGWGITVAWVQSFSGEGEKVWRQRVVMTVQKCECTYRHGAVHLKWLKWLCIFYHNKNIFNISKNIKIYELLWSKLHTLRCSQSSVWPELMKKKKSMDSENSREFKISNNSDILLNLRMCDRVIFTLRLRKIFIGRIGLHKYWIALVHTTDSHGQQRYSGLT